VFVSVTLAAVRLVAAGMLGSVETLAVAGGMGVVVIGVVELIVVGRMDVVVVVELVVVGVVELVVVGRMYVVVVGRMDVVAMVRGNCRPHDRSCRSDLLAERC